MADFTDKKLQFITEMIGLADRLLLAAEDCDALDAAYSASVNGFLPGGAEEIVDGDFAIRNKHLSQAAVSDIMFAIGTLNSAFTDGVLNSLRKALHGGLP